MQQSSKGGHIVTQAPLLAQDQDCVAGPTAAEGLRLMRAFHAIERPDRRARILQLLTVYSRRHGQSATAD